MKLANIIYEKELVNHTEIDYINYFKGVQEYDKLDKTLPTLYVGWSFMKACNPDNEIVQNVDILKKRIISNELYWECSFEESKSSHVRGIEYFVNLIPQFYFVPKYKYINLDPVFFQITEIQDLMDVLPKKIDATYNYKNEMLYILNENNISGVNIDMYKYFQFNVDEILLKIKERTTNSIEDLDATTYQSYYKILPNFTHLKRYLITILNK